MAASVRVVDGGDVDIHPMDFHETSGNITETIRKILSRGRFPS